MTEQPHAFSEHSAGSPSGVRLSVRGNASLIVPPDLATIHCSVRASGPTKSEAMGTVAVAWQKLAAALAGLGGAPLSATNGRHPLTWSAGSLSTYRSHDYDERTGQPAQGSLTTASLDLSVTARDLALVPPLGDLFAQHGEVELHQVVWAVDEDNAAWLEVRRAAVQAAIAKARHYATSLGASVERIDQLADEGLLAGGVVNGRGGWAAVTMDAALSRGGPQSPALDPVPQRLTAGVDAQFVTSPVTLLGSGVTAGF